MKNEKILKAMSSISDELIEDANLKNLHLAPNHENATSRKFLHTRKLIRFGIAAALLVGLLGITAFAVHQYYRPFNGYEPQLNDPVEVVTPTRNGVSYAAKRHDITFRLPLNENAPELIVQYYFPDVPDMYEQNFGMAYDGVNHDRLLGIDFGWHVPGGAKYGIWFEQESAGNFQGNEIHTVLYSTPDTEPTVKEMVLGGVSGLLLTEPQELKQTDLVPRQHFYWSDGNYVFHIYFPIDFTEEQMGEIIASVKEVEDIRPYLISMTEEDKKETFG